LFFWEERSTQLVFLEKEKQTRNNPSKMDKPKVVAELDEETFYFGRPCSRFCDKPSLFYITTFFDKHLLGRNFATTILGVLYWPKDR